MHYNFDAIDADGNGKVSKTELGDFLSEFGMNPLSVTVDNLVRSIPANSQTQFFKALDSDGDGKLSAKELEAAGKMILKHDKDEDERLDIFEVIGGGPPVGPEFAQVLEMQRPRPQPTVPARVQVVDPEAPSGTIGNVLLAHYRSLRGRSEAGTLTAKEIGLDADTFKALDRDKDGELSVEELDQFAKRKPECVLTARMGKRDAKAALLDGEDKGGPVRMLGDGQFRVPGMLWVEGRVLTGLVDESLVSSLTRGYKLEFEAADRNGDGKVDAAERKMSALFSTIGDAIDRDGNGAVEQQEVGDWVDQIVQPLAQVLTNRASVTISQPGNGLWDLLYINRDGFLSERELRRASVLLKEIDRNGDGQLQAEEVPGAYQVMVSRGEATLSSRGQLVRLELAPNGRLTYPSRQDFGGPTWFRKMDRNGDGDVSIKEFLGTPAQFAKLDRDKDGLISLEEAEASK